MPVLASVAAGRERRQLRARARIEVALPAVLVLPDGRRRALFVRDTWVDLGIYAVTCEERGFPWKGTAKAGPR